MDLKGYPKNKLLAIGAITLLIIILWVWAFLYYREAAKHVDTTEVACSKTEINSFEINTDTNTCFETKISSCQKPTFETLKSCEDSLK